MSSPSVCHPDRPASGRGLCKPCYCQAWSKGLIPRRKKNPPVPAACHPGRISYNKTLRLCRSCYNAKAQREWRKRNPMRHHATLLAKHGLSQVDYDRMWLSQGRGCKLCGGIFVRTPHIDHNHRTNEVRGLLCGRCTTLVGFIEKSGSDLLLRVNKYLQC